VKLVLVTNRNLALKMPFLQVIRECCIAGINEIHLREKDLPARQLYELASRVKSITAKYGVPLVISHDVSVALAVEASGVHLGFSSLPLEKAREICSQQKLRIGVSVHSLSDTEQAQGADYIIAGHIFPTACKEDLEPKGTAFLQELKKLVQIPVIAIGGISPENIGKLNRLNIDGAAIMSGLMTAEKPAKYVEQIMTGLTIIKQ